MSQSHPYALTRRQWLTRAAATGLALSLPLPALLDSPVAAAVAAYARQQPDPIPTRPRGTARLVHMTDWHHMPRRDALGGMRAALEHALRLKPDLILQGGDMMTHTMDKPLDEMRPFMADVIDLFNNQRRRVPMLHCLGNHDIWGWSHDKSGSTGDEPEYGKRWWLRHFGAGRRYRSLKAAGWHIVVLDAIQPRGDGGYFVGLDDEQFDWLEHDLAGNNPQTPVLVLSHAPILSAATLVMDGHPQRPDSGYQLGHTHMFMDAHRLLHLFEQSANVRLVVAGHKHSRERIDFQGTAHIGGGAVCGNWWRPSQPRQDAQHDIIRPAFADPGVGVIDLHPDGRFRYLYNRFAWGFVKS